MIVIDTNVVSEALRPEPDASVMDWLDRQHPTTLWISAVSWAELVLGVQQLPDGRRRDSLRAAMAEIVSLLFDDRFLEFDRDAADRYGSLVADAQRRGNSIAVADGQIAASALSRGFAVATRDTAPFLAAGVPVIDPWVSP